MTDGRRPRSFYALAAFFAGFVLFLYAPMVAIVARSPQVMGSDNTLPMQHAALTTTVTTPEFYALGTVTTASSLLAVGLMRTVAYVIRRSRTRC